MKRIKRKSLFLFAFLFLIPATCMAVVFERGTWRYKMTVTIETPEGLKIGSAVREVSALRYPTPFPEDPGAHIRLIYGEAVVVDLGERGVLFAVMFGRRGVDYGHMLPFGVFSKEAGSLSAENIRRFSTLQAGPVEIEQQWYPVMVYFKDITNPKTVTEARDLQCPPGNSLCDRTSGGMLSMRMEKAFGTGVRIKSVTLEMSEEPVTRGIVDRYLPWIDEMANLPGYLGSDPKEPGKDPTGTWVQTGAFKKGK